MNRKTRILVIAVDVDPIPGGFDETRVDDDLRSILGNAIPHYNPQVVPIDTLIRESNFTKDVDVHVMLDRLVTFNYKRES